jgi:hypothetical protein
MKKGIEVRLGAGDRERLEALIGPPPGSERVRVRAQ